MAIYHLHAKIIKRSAGKNVIASAAYRRGAKLFDEQGEKEWNYLKKEHVVHSELIIPDNSPAWAKELVELHRTDPSGSAEKLWNLVEVNEKLKNSQLAREIEFALPMELTLEQNILLAREYIKDQFILRGMIADWNVHWDKGNPHVHVLLTMRELKENGFGYKVREWDQKELLVEWRSKWAEYTNFHLRMHQHDAKIDHRSYEEQGIKLIPTVHQGKAVTDMDRRGIQTNIMQEANEIRRENLNRISENPGILFDKLSYERESFTAQQLGQELGRYINDQGKFSIEEKNGDQNFSQADVQAFGHNEMSLAQKGILASSLLNSENAPELFGVQNTENPESQAPFSAILAQANLLLGSNSPSANVANTINSSNIDASTPEGIAKILTSIEHFDSVFTEVTIAKAISDTTKNAEELAKALIQVNTLSRNTCYYPP